MPRIGSRTRYQARLALPAAAGLLVAVATGRAEAQDTAAAQPMAPVVVTADASTPHWLRGFYRRRQGSGGYFITREQMASHDDSRMTDMLRSRVPSVQLSGSGFGRSRLRLRGQRCAPMVWLDGAPTPAGEFDLDVLQVSTIAAVEVYPGGASAPVEFRTSFGRDGCGGVIVVWSRVGLDEADEAAEAELESLSARPPTPVYRWDEVDESARIDSTTMVTPQYPDSLFAFSIDGFVVASIVVDTTGAAVPGSVEIVSATSPAFGAAVKAAIVASRFSPARKGGRPVRQVLVVPYRFTARRG